MLFILFRLVFGILIFVICFLLIRKSHIVHKRRGFITGFMIAVVLTTISGFIPIENAFITFSSPQSAYQYNHSENIELIVNGEKTDFIIGLKGDTDVYTIVPKSDDGWKLGMGFDTKRIAQVLSGGVSVYVYQYKDSDDYYITVLDTNGGPTEITDNKNSKFQYLSQFNSILNKDFYTYYAYVNHYDDQYRLTVNGKAIRVQE